MMLTTSPSRLRVHGRMLPLVLLVLSTLVGCSSSHETIHYAVTTDISELCCRTIYYGVSDFPDLRSSTVPTDGHAQGLVVRLHGDSIRGACGDRMLVPLTISNVGDSDLYVPVSHELEGTTIKLYPWILYFTDDRPVRLARQIQYGDLLERTDSRLIFRRIPAGKEVSLTGLISKEWLCKPEVIMNAQYLKDQLDPKYWSDHTRALRTPAYWDRAESVHSEVGLRYDVSYTTLSFVDDLMRTEQTWNAAHDSTAIHLKAHDEPAAYINRSLHVAESNIVTILIDLH